MSGSSSKAIVLPVRIAMIFLSIQLLSSNSLWYTDGRSFPLVPVVENLMILDGTIVLAGCVLTCALAFIWPKNIYSRLAVLLWFSFLILLDLNRFQVWIYYYLLIITSTLLPSKLSTLRWIIAAVYTWGGINKITPWFAIDQFDWFCTAFTWSESIGKYPVLGYSIALIELMLGIGLLWNKSRIIFRYLVMGFHIAIIMFLSPIGLNWNDVVIPWNIAMILHVYFLFGGQSTLKFPQNWASLLLVGFVWIVPVFSFINLTPKVLSWNMYSNTQPEASLFMEDSSICSAILPIWELYSFDNNRKMLINDWAYHELNVPAWNGKRTYKYIRKYMKKCDHSSEKSGLIIVYVNHFNYETLKLDTIKFNVEGK